MPDARLVVPEARARDVLVRPILSGIVVGVAIATVVSIWLATTGELDAADLSAWAILATPALIFAALGALQAVWWSLNLGGVRYEADDGALRVWRRHAVLAEWRWDDIRRLRVDGAVDWYALVVLKAGVDDFPHLVVESSDGAIRAPGLLIWGRDNAQRIQRSLVDMHRTHSHWSAADGAHQRAEMRTVGLRMLESPTWKRTIGASCTARRRLMHCRLPT